MPGTYEPIATTTLGSGVSSYTFNSIPQTYTDLVLIIGNFGNTANNWAGAIRLNGDSSSIYSWTSIWASQAGKNTERYNNYSTIPLSSAGFSGGETDSIQIVDIFSYSDTTRHKIVLTRNGTGYREVQGGVASYRSNSAITSLLFYTSANQFTSGTTLTLYGIKAA